MCSSDLLDLRPDWLAGKILFRLRQRGDDKLLGAVIAEFERAGLPVLSSADFLPNLRVPEGVLSIKEPNDEEWEAIRYGWPLLLRIGELDIGQCLIVKKGCVVAVEGIDGTDATILRAGQVGGGISICGGRFYFILFKKFINFNSIKV